MVFIKGETIKTEIRNEEYMACGWMCPYCECNLDNKVKGSRCFFD